MKNFNNYIILENKNEIEKLLLENCQPFFKEMKGSDNIFYRCHNGSFQGDYQELKPHKNRMPRDTDKKSHEIINSLSEEKIGWGSRNAIFATTSFETASIYDTGGLYEETGVYVFIPIGDFKYAYIPGVEDLYNVMEENPICSFYIWSKLYHNGEKDEMIVKEWLSKRKEFLENLVDMYETTDLKNATDVEVSFKCESYYLIELQYKDLI